jgi:Ankyrin repeats (3 copies)
MSRTAPMIRIPVVYQCVYECLSYAACSTRPSAVTCRQALSCEHEDADVSQNKLDVTDVFDYDGRTPLHLAGAEGALATTEWLLRQGVAVNAVDRFGHTPLMDALLAERTAVSQALIEVRTCPIHPSSGTAGPTRCDLRMSAQAPLLLPLWLYLSCGHSRSTTARGVHLLCVCRHTRWSTRRLCRPGA